MNSELNILKNIWGNKGKSYVKLISNQTGLGLDYVRYICKQLLKKGQIKAERKPNWYRITAKGKKELKLLGIIFKPKIFKEDNKGIKKVILPWPNGLLKVRLPKGKEIPVEEKKLRLGKMVEKIISSLRVSTFSAKPPHQKFGGGGKGRRRGRRKRKRYARRRKIKSH